MGKCTDNPKYDKEESSVQNTFKHTVKVLTTEEVMENRSSAYEFIDFDLEAEAKKLYPVDISDHDSCSMIEFDCNIPERNAFKAGAEYMKTKMYSEEDLEKAWSQGWVTRERFDDLSPEIIYPKGLDYEEKQEYAFNLWFNKFKK